MLKKRIQAKLMQRMQRRRFSQEEARVFAYSGLMKMKEYKRLPVEKQAMVLGIADEELEKNPSYNGKSFIETLKLIEKRLDKEVSLS